MPCLSYDSTDDYERIQLAKLEASLCAILTVLERDDSLITVARRIDWKEVGVSRTWLFKWWAAHKVHEHDRARKAEAEKRQLARTGWDKLTAPQRQALGLTTRPK